ncbi:MAG: hypothetical protein U1E59_14200 [Amaricoccus sp.]
MIRDMRLWLMPINKCGVRAMRIACIASLIVAVGLAVPAESAVLLQVKERIDPGVVVKVSGSLDLTGLGTPTVQKLDSRTAPLISAGKGYIGAGLPGLDDSNLFADVYKDVFTNPVASFGSGGQADHWSDATTWGFFAVAMADNALMLPAGYESNSPIHAFTDFIGAPGFTFASLGITEGSYDFALVNGEHVTVEIAPVPLPDTAWLLAGGLLALAAVGLGSRRSAIPGIA